MFLHSKRCAGHSWEFSHLSTICLRLSARRVAFSCWQWPTSKSSIKWSAVSAVISAPWWPRGRTSRRSLTAEITFHIVEVLPTPFNLQGLGVLLGHLKNSNTSRQEKHPSASRHLWCIFCCRLFLGACEVPWLLYLIWKAEVISSQFNYHYASLPRKCRSLFSVHCFPVISHLYIYTLSIALRQ